MVLFVYCFKYYCLVFTGFVCEKSCLSNLVLLKMASALIKFKKVQREVAQDDFGIKIRSKIFP